MPKFHVITGDGPTVQSRSARLTPAQRRLRGTPLRQIGWLQYPDGLGRIFQAVDYPRLTQISRTRTGGADTFWLVDGVPVLDVDEAIEALDIPPVLSAEELELLRQVPNEWTTAEDLRALITAGIPHADGYARIRLLRALADKGFLEADDARIRRGSLPSAD